MHSTYDQTIEISDLRGKNHMLRWVIAIAAVLAAGPPVVSGSGNDPNGCEC